MIFEIIFAILDFTEEEEYFYFNCKLRFNREKKGFFILVASLDFDVKIIFKLNF